MLDSAMVVEAGVVLIRVACVSVTSSKAIPVGV